MPIRKAREQELVGPNRKDPGGVLLEWLATIKRARGIPCDGLNSGLSRAELSGLALEQRDHGMAWYGASGAQVAASSEKFRCG